MEYHFVTVDVRKIERYPYRKLGNCLGSLSNKITIIHMILNNSIILPTPVNVNITAHLMLLMVIHILVFQIKQEKEGKKGTNFIQAREETAEGAEVAAFTCMGALRGLMTMIGKILPLYDSRQKPNF
ncbi:hypothetical protein ACJX0J_011443 [Zea mays]